MTVRFDASADALSRTTNLPAVSAFTMMGWFRIAVDRNDFSAALVFGDSGGAKIAVWGTGGDGTTLSLYDGASDHGGTALSVNTWYHLAMTCSGTSLIGYLNGVSDATGTLDASVSAEQMYVGNNSFGEFWNGRSAAVKIYGAALTAAEIVSEMRQYCPVRWANLNSFYPLLSASLVNDQSANGYSWTVGGTLTTEEGPPIPWRISRRRVSLPSAGGAPAAGHPAVKRAGGVGYMHGGHRYGSGRMQW